MMTLLHPFREAPFHASPAFDPEVATEMQQAVALLWRWRRYAPAIAGGSLWAWAANRRARDVDLFMYSTWASRRAIGRHYGPSVREQMGQKWEHSGYDRIAVQYPIDVYRTRLDCGAPVDLVLTEWKHGQVTEHFDYWHCMVAFGVTARVMTGVDFYERGQLKALNQGDRARDEDTIRAKIQTSLWGNREAPHAMFKVMATLEGMLAAVQNGVEWVDEGAE